MRKLSAPAREQMRKIILRLHAQGYGFTTIAQMLGFRRPTVSGWLMRIRKGLGTGERKRGRCVGTGRRLTEDQESRTLQEITTHTPDQLGLPYALWTAQAVSSPGASGRSQQEVGIAPLRVAVRCPLPQFSILVHGSLDSV